MASSISLRGHIDPLGHVDRMFESPIEAVDSTSCSETSRRRGTTADQGPLHVLVNDCCFESLQCVHVRDCFCRQYEDAITYGEKNETDEFIVEEACVSAWFGSGLSVNDLSTHSISLKRWVNRLLYLIVSKGFQEIHRFSKRAPPHDAAEGALGA